MPRTAAELAHVETRPVPIEQLTRFPGNARRGDINTIRASLRTNGQYRSLVVRDTGHELVILAGNHTRDAAVAEGWREIRCEIIVCDDANARRINLVDNRASDLGSNDNDALVELLSYANGDYAGTGYTQGFVDHLLDGWAASRDDETTGVGPDGTPDPVDTPDGDETGGAPAAGTAVTCPECSATFPLRRQ